MFIPPARGLSKPNEPVEVAEPLILPVISNPLVKAPLIYEAISLDPVRCVTPAIIEALIEVPSPVKYFTRKSPNDPVVNIDPDTVPSII